MGVLLLAPFMNRDGAPTNSSLRVKAVVPLGLDDSHPAVCVLANASSSGVSRIMVR